MSDGRHIGSRQVDPLVNFQLGLFAGGLVATIVADLGHLKHVGRRTIDLEEIADALFHAGWRERPERFAVLDFKIQHRLHLGGSGVANDGAVAQGAGAKFHPALEHAHNLLIGNIFGNLLFKVSIGKMFIGAFMVIKPL